MNINIQLSKLYKNAYQINNVGIVSKDLKLTPYIGIGISYGIIQF